MSQVTENVITEKKARLRADLDRYQEELKGLQSLLDFKQRMSKLDQLRHDSTVAATVPSKGPGSPKATAATSLSGLLQLAKKRAEEMREQDEEESRRQILEESKLDRDNMLKLARVNTSGEGGDEEDESELAESPNQPSRSERVSAMLQEAMQKRKKQEEMSIKHEVIKKASLLKDHINQLPAIMGQDDVKGGLIVRKKDHKDGPLSPLGSKPQPGSGSLVKLHLSGITDDEPSPRTKKTKIEERERGQSEAEEEDEDWVPPSNQTG